MSKYSNCTKEQAVELIKSTEKPIRYTYGLEYRNPTTCRVLIDKEKALEYMGDKYALVDCTEYDDWIHIKEYSSNDMW
jgi:hypothetical protein